MLFSWTVFTNALICQICAFVIFLRVAAADGALNISQIYTVTFGETAKLSWPRSDRETFQDFKFYRAWKNNITFAVLRRGSQTAACVQNVLEQFCLTKTDFKFWNNTILMLKIKNATLDDEGKYTVQHVFRQMEGNHRDEILLEVKDLSMTSSAGSSLVQSVVVGASTTALPIRHTSDLSVTSSGSSSVQSVVIGESTTALPIHQTSELSTPLSGPSGRASSGGLSFIILGRSSIVLFVLLFIL